MISFEHYVFTVESQNLKKQGKIFFQVMFEISRDLPAPSCQDRNKSLIWPEKVGFESFEQYFRPNFKKKKSKRQSMFLN